MGLFNNYNEWDEMNLVPEGTRISRPQAHKYLVNHFSTANLRKPFVKRPYIAHLESRERNRAPAPVFRSNKEFWMFMLEQAHPSQIDGITLVGFRVIDWFPRAPGYYYLQGASKKRRKANQFLEPESITTFAPEGKELMVVGGGVGTYRFNPFIFRDTQYFLCTATSGMYCHSGVPLAIPDYIFREIDFEALYEIQGHYANIHMPLKDQHFPNLKRVPNFYLIVDNIAPIRNASNEPVFVTPVIYMKGSNDEDLISYRTCDPNDIRMLNNAAEWLEEYARRYQAEILTNYDELIPAFANVPFSLQKISNRELNFYKLQQIGFLPDQIILIGEQTVNNNDFRRNVTIQGDNNHVIIDSSIQNSFNHIESSNLPEEIKSLLRDLTTQVDALCKTLPDELAEQIREDLESLTGEARKKQPTNEVIKIYLDKLGKAAQKIGKVAVPVLEIVAKLLLLIPS